MTFSTFPEILWNCTDPDTDTIRFSTAAQAAKDHGVWDDFRTDFGTLSRFGGINTHEFLEWLGY